LKESGETAKKEPTEKEKKQAKCSACGSLWTSATRICANCGFERPSLREISKVPGELRELDAANRGLHVNNQEFYSQVLFYAKTRGYKDGWAAYKYKEKFGVWPRGLQEKLQPPSPETMGWIQSRMIAYAKARAR
jgi:ribosomal protein L37E